MNKTIIFILLCFQPLICYAQSEHAIKTSLIVKNVYKIEIGTVNLVVFKGYEGLLLSDCGYRSSASQLDSTLKTLSHVPLRYVINTHWHHDHCGGNYHFHQYATIISHEDTKKILSQNDTSAFWNEEYFAFAECALPDITFKDKLNLFLNGQEIEIIHFPGGHSDGDIIVYFKDSKVIHLGDLLFSFGFPAIDFEHGGNVRQFAVNLEKIIQMVPDDVIIIAGHGPNFTKSELHVYKNMIQETFSIIEASMANGSNNIEMKHKNILKDYEAWAKGYFSCDDWIDIVYHSLIYKNK